MARRHSLPSTCTSPIGLLVTVTETNSNMAPSSDKKSKRDKGEKSEHKSSKKRLREAQEAEAAEAEHQHKRAKSEVPTVADDEEAPQEEKKKKKKKDRKSKDDAPEAEQPAEEEEVVETSAKKDKKKKKKHSDSEPVPVEVPVADDVAPGISNENTQIEAEERKHKKEKKKDKHRKKEEPAEPVTADAMDIDTIPDATAGGSFGKLPPQPFPFYTQTVSQYLALYPSGMVEPIEGYVDQHLKPLLNRYVPEFKGVLLGHRKVRIGEAPGKASLTEESDMTDQALLESIDEYAVGFGWLTAEVDLFRPSRGALLEGVVNLQTEGHLGVVCWDMFNASIEAARLPEGWRWVDLLSKDKTTLPTPEPANEGETAEGEAEGEAATDDVAQLHTTGYWVDEKGDKVRTIQFRVKNYEVGHSGDYGFLSIEGTMLSEEDEKQKLADELEWQRRRRLRHGGQLRREHKRLPAFSMTKFGGEDEEEKVNPNETAQALSEVLAVEE